MNIRSLAKQGYSQRQIAKMTGLNRRTVRKYLVEQTLPVYHGQHRKSGLEPYHGLIEGWLSQEDYQAAKIHELVCLQGYQGSYMTVNRYVRKIKEQRDRKAFIRFETMPGQQAQVDFGDFKIIQPDGSMKTVYAFCMVLGFSRHMYVEFLEHCTMTSFLCAHQNAFGFFGGIPAEILYDNMKNVVIRRSGTEIQWNREFSAFACHSGFKSRLTPPYSPWVKGKVERPMQYLRERFWRGYTFLSTQQANQDIRHWLLSTAQHRVHGTTQEKITDRFSKERSFLGSLPQQPYDISERVYRYVHKDCQIFFDGNRYVVPHECVGHKVLLKIREGVLRIFKDDKMVCLYQIPEEKGRCLSHPEFYERLVKDRDQNTRKYRLPYGKARASTRGLLKEGLSFEVMKRPLSLYGDLIKGVSHV